MYDTSPTQSANNSGHVTPTNEPSIPTGSGTSNALAISSPPVNTISREVAPSKDHPLENMLTPLHSGIQTRASSLNLLAFNAFVSLTEPSPPGQTLEDPATLWPFSRSEERRVGKECRL